ncbi:hypothetical protein BH09PSE5_BH09PSE5_18700 [soil metagenome]
MIAAAALWLIACGIFGAPTWMYFGALAIVLSQPLVLGAEFVVLYFAHGDDPVPRARPGAMFRAWLAESWISAQVFCWRQPFRSHLHPDNLGSIGPSKQHDAVVLVHGFVCNRGAWAPMTAQLERANMPFIAVNLEPVFAESIDEYVPIVERAVNAAIDATGRPPVIVAHSMGGLVVRAWLAGDGARQHAVKHVITIGSPHRGTLLARFARAPNARQMRLDSPWVEKLGSSLQDDPFAGFTCFYSDCDNIVMPCSTAALPGADNRLLRGAAHLEMAFRPEVWDEVERWAKRAPLESASGTITAESTAVKNTSSTRDATASAAP